MNLPKSKSQDGFSSIILLVVLLLVIVVVGFFFWTKWQKIESVIPLLSSVDENASFVYLMEVPYLKTGSEVCYEEGLSCLGMRSTQIFDSSGEFYGYVTPSCDSQVIKKPACEDLFDTQYALDNIEYVKSPNSTSKERLGADYFCAFSEKGKKGTFEFAYCVKREL